MLAEVLLHNLDYIQYMSEGIKLILKQLNSNYSITIVFIIEKSKIFY
jgi:hypothetical protein